MAQYGHNLYGTSYYGDTNAINGFYTSEVIDAREVLKENLKATVIVELPLTTYNAVSTEFVYSGSYTAGDTYVDLTEGTGIFKASLNYLSLDFSGTGLYILRRKTDASNWTIVEQGALDSSNGSFVKSDIQYAMYELEIIGTLRINSITCQVCDINLYTRDSTAKDTVETGTLVDSVILTKNVATEVDVADLIYPESRELNSRVYTIEYVCTDDISEVSPKQYYQFQLEMLSSDNEVSPAVRELILHCGNTNLFDTGGGTWEATFDFGPGFRNYEDITWTYETPDGTSLEVRSQSSTDKTTWGNWSNPYTLDTTQLRLKDAQREGYLKTKYTITPRHLKYWKEIVSTYYDADTRNEGRINPVRFEFYDSNDNRIGPDIAPTDHNLKDVLLQGGKPVPMSVKVWLQRLYTNDNTPTIDIFDLVATCEYVQTKHKTGSVSKVYGEKPLTTVNALGFTDRPEESYGPVEYTITPSVNGKDVTMYWQSERDSQFRDLASEVLNSQDDQPQATVCAISNERSYFNYGVTMIYFKDEPTIRKALMTNSFKSIEGRPIDTTLKYQYKIFDKWVSGEDWTPLEDHDSSDIPMVWETPVDGSHHDVTDVSEVNGSVVAGELTNDNIVMTARWYDNIYVTPWQSAYYTYDAVVNPHGLEIPYVNDQVALPPIDDYAFVSDNCYQFEIVQASVKRNGITVPGQAFDLKYDIKYPLDTELYTDSEKTIPNPAYIVIDRVTHGSLNGTDHLRYNFTFTKGNTTNYAIDKVLGVFDTYGAWPRSMVLSDYKDGLDYTIDYETSTIDWTPDSGEPEPKEPEVGKEYFVYYVCRQPKYASVTISCDYKEKKVIKNEPWTSSFRHEFTGACAPAQDYVSDNLNEILPMDDSNQWGILPVDITNLKYTVIDDNPWVETTVEVVDENTSHVKGTLGLRNSDKNWYPTILSGFYYAGKQEYYHYVEPVVVHIGPDKIEYAESVSYKDSWIKKDNQPNGAVLVQDGSTNLITNSDFKLTDKKLAYICRFKDLTSVAQGPNKPIEWPTE